MAIGIVPDAGCALAHDPANLPRDARRKASITITVNQDGLPHFTDEHLAQLWHIAQANPAPFGDRDACDFAEAVGREIITRWLASVPPALWHHQGRHIQRAKALNAPAEAILYEHDDGRYRVARSAEEAEFTRDEPVWHRAGPVDVSDLRGD